MTLSRGSRASEPRRRPARRPTVGVLARRRTVGVLARRRTVGALVVALVCLLALPSTALAHLRTGTIAVDDRVSVLHPHTAAYDVRIFQSDRGLSLTLRRGHAVALVGYLGEPVFRLDSTGLWINTASPTAVVSGLLTRAHLTRPRGTSVVPDWRVERGRTSVAWHDSRVQEQAGGGTPRGEWSVPLLVDGHRAHLLGHFRAFGKPALIPWLVILVCLVGAVIPAAISRRGERRTALAAPLGVVAAGASVVLAFAFAFDAYASPGTWIEALDELAFVAAGLGLLLLGPRHLRAAAAAGLGFVSLAVGLLSGAVFLHPIVLAVLPALVTRVLGVMAIGLGTGAVILGCLVYTEPAAATSGLEDDLGLAHALAGVWDPLPGDHRDD
jgi:hypothetical protein